MSKLNVDEISDVDNTGPVTVTDGLTVQVALKVPVGTEAQRPTPETGQLRFNSDATSFEGYDGSAWGAIGGAGVPSGVIALWSGSIGSIPADWVICDGTNSTPDLRDRFVIGAGSTYAVDATGGSTTTSAVAAHTHTLSGNTDASGNHTHTGSTSTTGNHSHNARLYGSGSNATGATFFTGSNSGGYARDTNQPTYAAGDHSHTFTTDAGGDHSHTISGNAASTGDASVSIMNPYYALCYIMKT